MDMDKPVEDMTPAELQEYEKALKENLRSHRKKRQEVTQQKRQETRSKGSSKPKVGRGRNKKSKAPAPVKEFSDDSDLMSLLGDSNS